MTKDLTDLVYRIWMLREKQKFLSEDWSNCSEMIKDIVNIADCIGMGIDFDPDVRKGENPFCLVEK